VIWYCDASAVAKRYILEVGSRWFRQQISQHHLFTSVLALAEVPSALARRVRDGSVSTAEFHRCRNQFARHVQSHQYIFLPASMDLIEHAALLIYRRLLAAYDAVHLATALHYQRTSGADPNRFYFVTADRQLQRAAQAEGLQTEDPNDHR
jgi:predicted nucleic acid-binding protein